MGMGDADVFDHCDFTQLVGQASDVLTERGQLGGVPIAGPDQLVVGC
jgi:hypothetical protein